MLNCYFIDMHFNNQTTNTLIKKKSLTQVVFENRNSFLHILWKRAFFRKNTRMNKKPLTVVTPPIDPKKERDRGINQFLLLLKCLFLINFDIL